jgi:hypothetical protein
MKGFDTGADLQKMPELHTINCMLVTSTLLCSFAP